MLPQTCGTQLAYAAQAGEPWGERCGLLPVGVAVLDGLMLILFQFFGDISAKIQVLSPGQAAWADMFARQFEQLSITRDEENALVLCRIANELLVFVLLLELR